MACSLQSTVKHSVVFDLEKQPWGNQLWETGRRASGNWIQNPGCIAYMFSFFSVAASGPINRHYKSSKSFVFMNLWGGVINDSWWVIWNMKTDKEFFKWYFLVIVLMDSLFRLALNSWPACLCASDCRDYSCTPAEFSATLSRITLYVSDLEGRSF